MTYKIFYPCLFSVFSIFFIAACSPTIPPTPKLTPVTVQLAWTHQAQFAGLYAADQKGYYKDEGLSVSFIEGGTNIDKLSPVVNGTTQFGIAGADELIIAREQAKPLKAVAVIYRQSPIVFVSLTEKGITKPQQFIGKTIRAPAILVPTLNAMMNRLGISPDQYSFVDAPTDIEMFASGDIPVWGMYRNAMLILIENTTYKVNIISPDDYGVHFYSDTLITNDNLINSNPNLVQRFTRASLKGWDYAVENPKEIPAIIQKYYPKADPDLEYKKMIASIRLVNTGEDQIGWMKPEIWTDMNRILLEQKVIKRSVDINELYTTQFLTKLK